MSESPPEILTVKEAAELLRCSEETVRVNARNGTLPALKMGGWKFLKADLVKLFVSEPPDRVKVQPREPSRRISVRGRGNGR